jgi:cytochrome c peroxidase
VGLAALDRNAPSVVNAAQLRWFSWDGGADSLWAQALRALLDPREMGTSAPLVAKVVRADRGLECRYRAAFGGVPAGDERLLVDAAKAIAAFVATRTSGRTPFDEFRDALARGDRTAAARYPLAAQRGLQLFVGKGSCSVCHFGAGFTNSEFHEIGVPFMLAPGRVDPGRHGGIKRLVADPYNLLGKYNDDPSRASATKTRHVELQHANFGQFKTPGLRDVARTAPYLHNGRLATLRDVVRHYSELDLERLHTHGEQLLRPLKLSEQETDDLVAFLDSLTDPGATAAPAADRPVAGCKP